MSGTALAPWGYHDAGLARKKTARMVESLHCNTGSSERIRDCLMAATAEEVQGVDLALTMHIASCPCRPTAEPAGPGAFLTRSPREVYAAGMVADVPFMTGFTPNEGCLVATRESKSSKIAFVGCGAVRRPSRRRAIKLLLSGCGASIKIRSDGAETACSPCLLAHCSMVWTLLQLICRLGVVRPQHSSHIPVNIQLLGLLRKLVCPYSFQTFLQLFIANVSPGIYYHSSQSLPPRQVARGLGLPPKLHLGYCDASLELLPT